MGLAQRNLSVDFACAPCLKRDCGFAQPSAVKPACFATLPPAEVWAALRAQMQQAGRSDA
jgi:heptosyltransferase-1